MEPFLFMPLTYHALVIETTTQCNARCGMCYQSSGPKGSDVWGKARLTQAEIHQVIEDAVGIPTLNRRFHLAGGEAFLDIELCMAAFSAARDAGYSEVSTTTNAFWASSMKRADEAVRSLRKAGLTRAEISWDAWHKPYIDAATVANCLRACEAAGIQTVLRVLTTRSNLSEEAIAPLGSAADLATEISICPVFPTGRAAKEIPEADIFYEGNMSANCHSVLNLTVNPRGDVAPCCAGADQTDSLSFGNIRYASVSKIAEAMNQSRLLRFLVFRGPSAILDLLEPDEIEELRGRRYSNICHLCWEIFSNPEIAAAVHRHFDKVEVDALTASLDFFEQQAFHDL